MTSIEEYLDEYKNTYLEHDILDRYNYFGYNDKENFIIDLEFLLDSIYTNIKLGEIKRKRLSQLEFSKEIKKLYKRCIITGAIGEECEACHIVPINNSNDYSIDNGLLLSANIHKTFDLYKWSIDPCTMEIKTDGNAGTIEKYKGKLIFENKFTSNFEFNLNKHYNEFKKKLNKNK